MRRRKRGVAPSSEFMGQRLGSSPDRPMMAQSPAPTHGNEYTPFSPHSEYNAPPTRLYDPNDPTTFPQAPASPTIGTQYSGPYSQNSGGYSGQAHHPGQYSGAPEI